MGIARCNRDGVIVEMNAAFEQRLAGGFINRIPLRLGDLVAPQDRDKTDFLLRELIESRRDTIPLSVQGAGGDRNGASWTAWRQAGLSGESEATLLVTEAGAGDNHEGYAESVFQAQRWEAIGRLTGGVVHDFNNLLTGVMLYCDLLLSALDPRDPRRRYAEEIRSAIVPASSLVQQLLVFAPPQETDTDPVSFNEIAESMRDLLLRLVGDNVSLELQLDPHLGSVKMARSQAQQVLLNLVLNARDALGEGGCIRIETSNGSFQPIVGGASGTLNICLPCILLSVTDNGHGMDAETRRRLFEPFFTTKSEKAGGLGLTTVHSIVTSHRGLVHFESEPGLGTRALILFPRATERESSGLAEGGRASLQITSATPLPDLKKESLL